MIKLRNFEEGGCNNLGLPPLLDTFYLTANFLFGETLKKEENSHTTPFVILNFIKQAFSTFLNEIKHRFI